MGGMAQAVAARMPQLKIVLLDAKQELTPIKRQLLGQTNTSWTMRNQ